MPARIKLVSGRESSLARSDDVFLEQLQSYNQWRTDVQFVQSPEQADLFVFFEAFSFKPQSYGSQILQDPIIGNSLDKVYVINTDDIPRGFLPGVYVSLSRKAYDPIWYRPGVYPGTYNEYLENPELRDRSPRYLFSFRGNLGSHPVRRRLAQLLVDLPEGKIQPANQHFHTHSAEQKRAYTMDLAESQFVLCPRGWSPTTYRLFEAMQVGRCPVIVSDDWLPIDGIDWSRCSIRIRERNLDRIPALLLERRKDATALGAEARIIWEQNFTPQIRFIAYLDRILQLSLARRTLVASSDGARSQFLKRWRSRPFRLANGWTLRQRIMNRACRLVFLPVLACVLTAR